MSRILFAALILISFSSCQKDLPDIFSDNQDSSQSLKLKQIHLEVKDPNDPRDYTFSIKYDSVNHKLNVYLDNPSTVTEIFDQLVYTYEFNPAGYLVKVYAPDNGMNPVLAYTINRDASNQIQSIIEHNPDMVTGGSDETIYFSYKNIGSDLIVQDSVNYSAVGFFQTQTIRLNSNKLPVAIGRSGLGSLVDSLDFHYNSLGELSTITGIRDTTEIVLDKSKVAAGWNKQAEIFLGKDAQVLALIDPMYSLLFSFMDINLEDKFETRYNVLLSPPLSRFTRHGFYNAPSYQDYGASQVNFTNSFSADNRLSGITISDGGFGEIKYTFSYY
ncbi:MAG: hypothetical protein ACJ749_06595 [Flavisolibacter sp.]